MASVVVVGSINIDLSINTSSIPVVGETILGNNFRISSGGKGANQATTVAKLGKSVLLIGCVGNDLYGKRVLSDLKGSKVKTDFIKVVNETSTGVAIIIINEGDNFIIVDPAANNKVDITEIEEEEISSCDIVVLQLEIPLETVSKVVEIAKSNNKKVLLNPAPGRILSNELLSKIDIITPNESECEIITGIKVNCLSDAKKAIYYFLDKGVKQVVITMGDKGCYYNSGREIRYKSAIDVVAMDTTGAGDSFTGAIAVAISEGMVIEDAIDFATAVSAIVVTKHGAQCSLPTLNEVKEFMNYNNGIM